MQAADASAGRTRAERVQVAEQIAKDADEAEGLLQRLARLLAEQARSRAAARPIAHAQHMLVAGGRDALPPHLQACRVLCWCCCASSLQSVRMRRGPLRTRYVPVLCVMVRVQPESVTAYADVQARVQEIEGRYQVPGTDAGGATNEQRPPALHGAADSLACASHVMANVRSHLAAMQAELATSLQGVSIPADRIARQPSAASSTSGAAGAVDRRTSIDARADGGNSPRRTLSRISTAGRASIGGSAATGGSAHAGGAAQADSGAQRFRHAAETIKSLNRTSMRFLALRDREPAQHGEHGQAHEHGGL